MAKWQYNIIDCKSQHTSFAIPVADMTSASHDADVNSFNSLQTAIEAVILGNVASKTLTHSNVYITDQKATDPNARREAAVRFTLAETGAPENKVTVTLGTPDYDQFPFATIGNDISYPPFTGSGANVLGLITALEAAVVYPDNGNAMTVVRMEDIGRNL
jgi:hypothetical protein